MTRSSRDRSDDPRGRRYSSSLRFGLEALLVVVEACVLDGSAGLVAVSERLGLPRSTVHRYLVTLTALGYLEQESRSRRYRLGRGVQDLGFVVLEQTGLPCLVRPILEALASATGCVSLCAVLDDVDVLVVDRARSHVQGQGAERGRCRLAAGSRFPASMSAAGVVLLAELAPGDPRRNRRSAARVARAGYEMVDIGGVSSLAVPVAAGAGSGVRCALEVRSYGAHTDALERHMPALELAAVRLGSALSRFDHHCTRRAA